MQGVYEDSVVVLSGESTENVIQGGFLRSILPELRLGCGTKTQAGPGRGTHSAPVSTPSVEEAAAHRPLGPLWSEAWNGMEGLWRGAHLQAVSGILTERSEVGWGPSVPKTDPHRASQQIIASKGIVRVPGLGTAAPEAGLFESPK
jgi:hypothetical protein